MGGFFVAYFCALLMGAIPATAILILSMRLTSQALGGIDFGEIGLAVAKGLALVVATLGVHFFGRVGVWVSLAFWLVGFPVLFRCRPAVAVFLALLNWYVGLVIALLFRVLGFVEK